jgi:hypothetical protein
MRSDQAVATCSAWGKDLPGTFPFCPFCGSPLSVPAMGEQRKTVTVHVDSTKWAEPGHCANRVVAAAALDLR